MDGGGEDVYEKNEIISVVTTKREDVRLVTIIDVFAHILVTLKQTRGRSVKSGLTGTKGRRPLCLNAFHALRSKFSSSFMFFPIGDLFFFLLLDTTRLD